MPAPSTAITAFGRTQTANAWARETGIKNSTILRRIAKGWAPETALATGPDAMRRTDSFVTPRVVAEIRTAVANGETRASVARRLGLGEDAVWRIVMGRSWADADGPLTPARKTACFTGQYRREERTWYAMIRRCTNPTHSAYADYGGRGIRVHPSWMPPGEIGFRNFIRDMGPRPEGMSIDRIDPDGDYEPSNCRWADRFTQANNKRGNKALREAPRLRARIAALEAEVARLRAAVARVERRQRGEDPRQLALVASTGEQA